MKPLLGYRRPAPGTQPENLHPPYVPSLKRAPTRPLIFLPGTLSEVTGPIFPKEIVPPKAFDLTCQGKDAPLDPHFTGMGQTLTDEEGLYRFITIRPGSYPWKNHYNAWRPQHIHFSLFGPAFATRLVTQMYFPGDPLQEFDPIFNSIPDDAARKSLISKFDWGTTTPEIALGFRFDIILRGRSATPMER